MLTVLMATHNGARTLPEVLSTFCNLDPPEGGWKLVIVDNGSVDATQEILTSFRRSLPLTYLLETRRGKNAALNTGLKSISGDLVVFTDDDVLPNSQWLKQMRYAADSKPSFSIFGGSIFPKWEVRPEPWLLEWVPLDLTFSITEALREGPIDAQLVLGPNMAIRRSIFNAGYKFDESIGPNGSNYAMGSETELLNRLDELGHKAWHVQEASVRHIVRSKQMSMGWILERFVRYGRGRYRMDIKKMNKKKRYILKKHGYLLKGLLSQTFKIFIAMAKSDDRKIFMSRLYLNKIAGEIFEARLIALEYARRIMMRKQSLSQ